MEQRHLTSSCNQLPSICALTQRLNSSDRRHVLHFDEKDLLAPDGEVTPPRESRGFAVNEMVACETCLRANPPTRVLCLYCATPLAVSAENVDLRRPALRRIEEWEGGYNVVLLPREGAVKPASELTDAAEWLRLDAARLGEMCDAGCPLPLARVATSEEAALIKEKFEGIGLRIVIISDDELAIEADPPKRIRKLEFDQEGLTGWISAGSEAHCIEWYDVTLLVRGRIFKKEFEVEERRVIKPGARKEIAEARALSDDEAVLDLYAAHAASGWRISAENFDYSGLGARKALLARDNFITLVETLRTRAQAAAFDDEYIKVRHLLAAAWPLAEHVESRGLRREHPGKFNTEAVTHVSNEPQFTRYGRLLNQCWRLRRGESGE